jgi:hypothetical protein
MGWAIGASSLPGDLLSYGEVLSLWEAAGQKVSELRLMHIAAIVEIATKLGLEHHEATVARALQIILEQ